MTPRRSDTGQAGPAHAGPALTGTDNEALIQALRNLWPILGPAGRAQATKTASSIKERQ